MKRPILTAAAVLLALASCAPKAAPPGSGTADAAGGKEPAPVVDASERIKAAVIGTPWMRETPNGRGTRQLEEGDLVTAVGAVIPDPNTDGAELQEIVASDGTEGYVNKWYVPKDTRPAVLVADAFVYTEPKATKLTEESLRPMLGVAAGNEGDVSGFVRIWYVGDDGYVKTDRYVKSDTLSDDPADIGAARLYALASEADNPDIKREFLKSAQDLRSPAFGGVVDAMLTNLSTGVPVQAFQGTALVNDDNVNVRSMPDVVLGAVKGRLNRDDMVTLVSRTVDKSVAGDMTDYWYEVKDAGWVFGAFLTFP